MEVFATVISGVIIYTCGQIMIRFVVDPIHRQRQTIGKIFDALHYYANIYSNPTIVDPRINEKTRRALRTLATELLAQTASIPSYGIWSRLRFVRNKQDVATAYSRLIYISNTLVNGDPSKNSDMSAKIKYALGAELTFES